MRVGSIGRALRTTTLLTHDIFVLNSPLDYYSNRVAIHGRSHTSMIDPNMLIGREPTATHSHVYKKLKEFMG